MPHNALALFSCQLMSQTTLVANIIELTLTRPEGFDWQVGDYLWLGSEQSEFKPFSIASLPSEGVIRLQIAIVPNLSAWLSACLAAPILQIKGSVSQYHWVDHQPILMLAGGTGITPLFALLEGHQAALMQQSVTLYWGVRRAELLFVKNKLDALASQYPYFNWYPVVSEVDAQWTGLNGLLPDILEQQIVDLRNHQVMICGPWPMVKALKKLAIDQGVDSENIQ